MNVGLTGHLFMTSVKREGVLKFWEIIQIVMDGILEEGVFFCLCRRLPVQKINLFFPTYVKVS